MSDKNLLTKSQIMALVSKNSEQGSIHECFTYHPDDGPVDVFDVTAMRAWAVAHPLLAPVYNVRVADVIDRLVVDRVFDEQRIKDLPFQSWMSDPAMVLVYDAGTPQMSNLLIDGVHRIIRRHREKLPNFPAYLIDAKYVIRPDYKEYVDGHKLGLDWGDDVVDGKIVKRGS